MDEGLEDRIRADLHLSIDDRSFRAEDGDALGHEAAGGGQAHGGVQVHHLLDGVGAQHFFSRAGGADGYDSFPVGGEQGGDIGEVQLAVGVVGGERVELREERGGTEAVDAGVDLRRGELVVCERLLLDDGLHLRRSIRDTEDAAVARGVGWYGGEDGHGRAFGEVEVAECLEGGGLDEGDVAREDKKVFRSGLAACDEVLAKLLHGVAGAALLRLQDEVNAGGGCGGTDYLRLVADDAVDLRGGGDGLGCGDDMQQQRLAADLMKDFGTAGLQTRAFARSHDSDSEGRGFHTVIIVSQPSSYERLIQRSVLLPVICRGRGRGW